MTSDRSDFSHNKLETLPDSLCNCIVLSFLHVEHNSLTHLPNEIGNLVNLDDLVSTYKAMMRNK